VKDYGEHLTFAEVNGSKDADIQAYQVVGGIRNNRDFKLSVLHSLFVMRLT